MSTAHNPIRLFETVVDECPYLPDQQSASILVDPDYQVDQHLFAMLSRSGFRRSGEMLYAPKCPNCSACVSVRIPSSEFKPSRSQKRCWRRNLDIRAVWEPVTFNRSHFELYLKYQRHRHGNDCHSSEQRTQERRIRITMFLHFRVLEDEGLVTKIPPTRRF